MDMRCECFCALCFCMFFLNICMRLRDEYLESDSLMWIIDIRFWILVKLCFLTRALICREKGRNSTVRCQRNRTYRHQLPYIRRLDSIPWPVSEQHLMIQTFWQRKRAHLWNNIVASLHCSFRALDTLFQNKAISTFRFVCGTIDAQRMNMNSLWNRREISAKSCIVCASARMVQGSLSRFAFL